jgi:hypothetical protein
VAAGEWREHQPTLQRADKLQGAKRSASTFTHRNGINVVDMFLELCNTI